MLALGGKNFLPSFAFYLAILFGDGYNKNRAFLKGSSNNECSVCVFFGRFSGETAGCLSDCV